MNKLKTTFVKTVESCQSYEDYRNLNSRERRDCPGELTAGHFLFWEYMMLLGMRLKTGLGPSRRILLGESKMISFCWSHTTDQKLEETKCKASSPH